MPSDGALPLSRLSLAIAAPPRSSSSSSPALAAARSSSRARTGYAAALACAHAGTLRRAMRVLLPFLLRPGRRPEEDATVVDAARSSSRAATWYATALVNACAREYFRASTSSCIPSLLLNTPDAVAVHGTGQNKDIDGYPKGSYHAVRPGTSSQPVTTSLYGRSDGATSPSSGSPSTSNLRPPINRLIGLKYR